MRVGMPRRKKAKVQAMPESSGEDYDKENGQINAGEARGAPDSPPPPPPPDDPPDAPNSDPFKLATDLWHEKQEKWRAVFTVVDRQQKKLKLAQRVHDAKMRRLDNGDKRKRRKSQFRAAVRTYETIIALMQAEHKTMFCKLKLAEAKIDELNAECDMYWANESVRSELNRCALLGSR